MKQPFKIDLSGQLIGRLSVIKYSGGVAKSWVCTCSCGSIVNIRGAHLRNGKTKSCGCLKAEKLSKGLAAKHGMHKTRTYKSWDSMLSRCLNPKDKCFHRYGGRGIKVNQDWLIFESFLRDMGERPSGKSIDRIDNDGDYILENCRWSSPKEQSNNTRSNHFYDYFGESMTARQISDKCMVPYEKLRSRLKRGWTMEKATKE